MSKEKLKKLWSVIEARDASISLLRKQVTNLNSELVKKEEVIQSQHAFLQRQNKLLEHQNIELEAYSAMHFIFSPLFRPFKGVLRKIYRLIRPRLGSLHQYPPRVISLPEHYYRESKLNPAPKITVITPSFQQAEYIERTIKSVLDQSYPHLEYYVQDGGSCDGTMEILKDYESLLSGWESVNDNGQSHALNLGFANTTGEIMAWLNSDDILLPGALSYVAEFFTKNPEVDVIYGHRLLIDINDQEIGRWMMPEHNDAILSWVDYIPQETVFWRRRIWDKVGGRIDESFHFAMDWDLLVRFRQAGARFARVPRFIGGFRIHPNQKTSAELFETGSDEMNRIRLRELGHIPSRREVLRAIRPYLIKHMVTDTIWQIKKKWGRFE